MENLTLKVSGAAEGLVTEKQFTKKQVADAIQDELNGAFASEKRIEMITQQFVDEYKIVAKYHSGTFLGFKISDDASDAFAAFPKK